MHSQGWGHEVELYKYALLLATSIEVALDMKDKRMFSWVSGKLVHLQLVDLQFDSAWKPVGASALALGNANSNK